jgi:hypothetical protein
VARARACAEAEHAEQLMNNTAGDDDKDTKAKNSLYNPTHQKNVARRGLFRSVGRSSAT